MATIIKEFIIDTPPAKAWEALRDFGAVHVKLAPGFLTACRMDGDAARIITFGNGMTVREQLVGIDEASKRLAYSATGGMATHHNASAQLFDAGGNRTRFVWTTDVLPDAAAKQIEPMMELGAAAMKKTLEQARNG